MVVVMMMVLALMVVAAAAVSRAVQGRNFELDLRQGVDITVA